MSDSLPILDLLPEILAALARRPQLILEAPPGAGKTTGLPPALLAAPWAKTGRILVLEPRRLAARAAAERMARQRGEAIGETIGYSLRLERRIGPKTRIECVTTGLFLRRLQADPALPGIAALLFDEFHERSLDADLALALALESQAVLRPDLRLIVMSATLEGIGLDRLLPEAERIASAGRSWPVQVQHLGEDPRSSLEDRLMAAIRLAFRDSPQGDILVFLPGQREIRRLEGRIARDLGADIAYYPLHGELDLDRQEAAIRPDPQGRRRIVLASAIAETSLTLQGIAIVIDSGLRRWARFDPVTGLTRLMTGRVALANADQRLGRAGREGPGIGYRLWSRESERGLPAHPPAEILTADLAGFALELALWGTRDPAGLRLLDPPPAAHLAEARELLSQLGALAKDGKANAHGRAMAAFGLHPRLAHMILTAKAQGWGAIACAIAALLSERDILPDRGQMPDADLRQRLEAFRGKAGASERMRRIRRQAEIWCRQIGLAWPESLEAVMAATGRVLALAYPDRIARSRGRDGKFRLANGRGAALDPLDPLAREEFLAIASLGDGEREARIFLAAPLTLAEIEEDFADLILPRDRVEWDRQSAGVTARREWRLGELALREKPLRAIDGAAQSAALIAGIRELGLGALPWSPAALALRARVAFLRSLGDPGGDWPDWSDSALLADLETWLGPYLAGKTRIAHLADLDLHAILKAGLTRAQMHRLDDLAPSHVALPSGSRLPIDYAAENGPVLAVRLQEMFGLGETPRIAAGRVPLLLHLLSPAGRPVQVTRDLGGFWKTSYRAVRADLRGRYPRHDWPDDPATAQPTRRAKPRAG